MIQRDSVRVTVLDRVGAVVAAKYVDYVEVHREPGLVEVVIRLFEEDVNG